MSTSMAELREIVAELSRSTKELRESQKESGSGVEKSRRSVDRQLKELGKQIGGLGRKFGSFAEGFAYNSIVKILKEDFGLHEYVSPSVTMRRGSREEEYDILAYSNGNLHTGMIVEIKSRLRQEDIDQMKRKLDDVFFWMPEHKNKTFYGMIAYVSGDADLKRQIIENGWYLANVGDEIFEMETPVGFQPRAYRSDESESRN